MGSYNNLDFVPTTARKKHQCSQCGKYIQPGVVYYKHIATPHHPSYCGDCKEAKVAEDRPWREPNPPKTSTRKSSRFWDDDDYFPFVVIFLGSFGLTGAAFEFVALSYFLLPLPGAGGLFNGYFRMGLAFLVLCVFLILFETFLVPPSELPKFSNKGLFSCQYHSNHPNKGWCVNCGAPICERCITYFTTMFNSKLPICPSCRHHKKVSYLVGALLIFVPMLITGIIFLSTADLDPLWYNTYRFFGYFFLFYSISIILLFRIYYGTRAKDHKRWLAGISEIPIPKVISNREILPCTHDSNPAVTRCERCGDSICHQCLHINGWRSLKDWSLQGKQYFCVKCYWTEKKLPTIRIIILSSLFFIPIIALISFFPIILFFGSLYGSILGFFSYKFVKYQWLYSKLQTGESIPIPIQDLLLNGRFYVSFGFGLLLAGLFLEFLNTSLNYLGLTFTIVGFALWNYERYIHLRRNTTLSKRVKDREIVTKICIHLFLAGSWLGITALYILPLHIPGDFTFILGMIGLFLLLAAFLLLLFINIIERWSDTEKMR